MRIPATLAALTLAIALGACSDRAKEETQEASNAVVSDMHDSANQARDAGEKATRDLEAAADRLGNRAAAAWNGADDKARRAADKAADKAGAELENAGRAIRD